jgi:hypothetical protein
VAAWARVGDPALVPSGDVLQDAQDQLKKMIPAASVFDPSSRTWTAPQHLEDPDFPAFDVKLATGPGNEVVVFWLFNEMREPELFPWKIALNVANGDPVQYSQIRLMHSRFDGQGFSAPHEFRRPGMRHYDVAMQGREIRIVSNAARLFSTAAPFRESTELTTWYFDYDEASPSWLPLDQTQGNKNGFWSLGPRIVALDDGSWRVTWKEYPFLFSSDSKNRYLNPTLYITDNLSDLANTKRPLYVDENPRAYSFDEPLASDPYRFANNNMEDYELGDAGNGEAWIALRWQTAGQPNLALVLDDGESAVPSKPGLAIEDDALEKRLTVARTPEGDLLLSYFKVPLLRTPVSVEVDEETHHLTQVSQQYSGELAMTRYTLTRNLSGGPVEIAGGLPAPGYRVKLRAPVVNSGDRGVTSATLSLYATEVEPGGRRGTPLLVAENVAVADPVIRGHTTSYAEVEWEAPREAVWQFHVVVDPHNAVQEFDETDNEGPGVVTGGTSLDLRGDLDRILLGKLEPSEALKLEANTNLDDVLDIADRF